MLKVVIPDTQTKADFKQKLASFLSDLEKSFFDTFSVKPPSVHLAIVQAIFCSLNITMPDLAKKLAQSLVLEADWNLQEGGSDAERQAERAYAESWYSFQKEFYERCNDLFEAQKKSTQ